MFSDSGSKKSAGFAIVSWLIVLALNGVVAIDLPAPLQRCHVDDESCIKAQAQAYIEHYKQGMPDLKIPSIDPLELNEVRALNKGAKSALTFKLLLSNTTLHKFGTTVVVQSVHGFSKDLSRPMKLSWDLFAPELEVHANYDVNGRIMILPLISKGSIVIHLNQVQAKSRVTVVPQKHNDGHYYLKISEYKTDSKVGSGHISMSNLFNGNAALHDSTLSMLNKEWDTLSADIQPRIMEAHDRVFASILQSIFDAFPYDALFEDV
ncbi:hypothetical protein ACLKA6_019606 [Drosophila palustris]